MKAVKKVYAKVKLPYSDPSEEQEYRVIMRPLLRDIYLVFFLFFLDFRETSFFSSLCIN